LMCNAICAAMAAWHYISDRRKQRAACLARRQRHAVARMARLATFKTLKTSNRPPGF
jgi:hypothetical protein